MKKQIYLALVFIASLFLTSCTSEILLKQNKDGTINVKFSSVAGEAFVKMVKAAASDDDGNVLIDEKAITKELENSGFVNVEIEKKNVIDINAQMDDFFGNSILINSGLINSTQDDFSANITTDKFVDFYNKADDDLVSILDMFLAPVFNDEQMSESEYIELLASFYGNEVANEIKNSKLKITLESASGKKSSKVVSLAALFTLQNPVIIN